MFVLLIIGGDTGLAFAFTGLILVATAIWHRIKGSSWLTPLAPLLGAHPARVGGLVGALAFTVGLALNPSTTPAEAGPSPEPVAAPTVTVTVTQTVTASPVPEPSPSPTATLRVAPEGLTAAAALAEIPRKGRAPDADYVRELFGPTWADVDRNGCDTRNDILARDLDQPTFQPGTNDCVVVSGVLQDPFTATVIGFTRGPDSTAVQVDHIVALGDAWQKGAAQLDLELRTGLANDPLNLLAVDGPTNLQKGDGDAATWLPPNKAFRCEYVSRQVAVKYKYGLWMTTAEADAISAILDACPGQQLPDGSRPTATPSPTASPSPSPTPSPSATPAAPPAQFVAVPPAVEEEDDQVVVDDDSDSDVSLYFSNCSEARAAGAAPLLRGEPGYRSALDRDDDGVACE
ncbi:MULTISPECIES: GmrSD restriction endonuclease domain-containing protein [Tessaracoccus]|uniref:GmrSD restriction endonuclease domain-containing protein n=1 Tax=Tessaracoccus TaxID=72763 RepID=UPI0012946DDA|nr:MULTISPECIES: DUF1524 domain-containing protein [Tessaracoccus]